MTQKYDLNAFRATTLTTDRAVAKDGLITDGELYYHLNSCPFFHTYNDGGVEEIERHLLPFLRRFFKNRMSRNTTYAMALAEFNEYLSFNSEKINIQHHKKYMRYFNNIYSLFYPNKEFTVLLPYFPYKYDYLTGCAELVIRTTAGIRIYVYDFVDGPITAESINYHGFILQLSGRILKLKGGEAPTSLACIYPATKTITYYTYNDNEKLESMITSKDQFIRRYGEHCAYCLQKRCSPLIDRHDKYGWKKSEIK